MRKRSIGVTQDSVGLGILALAYAGSKNTHALSLVLTSPKQASPN